MDIYFFSWLGSIQGPGRFEVFISISFRHCHERIADWFPTIIAESDTEVMAGARCYPACRPIIDCRSFDPPIQQKVVAPNVLEIMVFRVAFSVGCMIRRSGMRNTSSGGRHAHPCVPPPCCSVSESSDFPFSWRRPRENRLMRGPWLAAVCIAAALLRTLCQVQGRLIVTPDVK